MTKEQTPTSAPATLLEDFDAFYMREFPRMVAIAAAVCGSRLAAEDIAQDAFVKAHRRWRKISHYDKPGAWVRRVTINLAMSALRRTKAEATARIRLTTRSADNRLAPAPDIDDEIWEAVAKLPSKQRASVALYYLEDASVAHIAEVLQCSESTAKVHLHRGRLALQKTLDVEIHDEN